MRKGDEMLFCNGGSRFIAHPIELAVLQKWFAIPTISHQLAASRHAVVDALPYKVHQNEIQSLPQIGGYCLFSFP
jgi:hypothetical protein